ncbi:hypothetical protein DFH11DRAFT_1214158 [Phellopilus nigrolimitatus]|nr:hypothetical protein DFH11DRAFT_1214158 [Phellopilus nigrolimitatus]
MGRTDRIVIFPKKLNGRSYHRLLPPTSFQHTSHASMDSLLFSVPSDYIKSYPSFNYTLWILRSSFSTGKPMQKRHKASSLNSLSVSRSLQPHFNLVPSLLNAFVYYRHCTPFSLSACQGTNPCVPMFIICLAPLLCVCIAAVISPLSVNCIPNYRKL